MSVAPRDTAGQERYASLAPLYYRGASAACVAYDITNAESFQKAKHWVSELQKNASGAIGERCLPALCLPSLHLRGALHVMEWCQLLRQICYWSSEKIQVLQNLVRHSAWGMPRLPAQASL